LRDGLCQAVLGHCARDEIVKIQSAARVRLRTLVWLIAHRIIQFFRHGRSKPDGWTIAGVNSLFTTLEETQF
jgi:hypothetical protein